MSFLTLVYFFLQNHALEEEKLRLQLEINQLQRNRRNSPTIKDEPLSPISSSSSNAASDSPFKTATKGKRNIGDRCIQIKV